MNKILLLIIILAVVFGGIIWFLGSKESPEAGVLKATPIPTQPIVSLIPSPLSSPLISPTKTVSPTSTRAPVLKTVVINITDSIFSPNEVTINAGDTVKFVNQANQFRWPASAVHPIHELYPGSSISKCGTPEANKIFDACRGLKTGESFSFTFNVRGVWPYHDHLAPALRGQIKVQ